MVRRHRTKAQDNEEWLDATYLTRRYVSVRDLGVIQIPKNYPKNKKKDRNYNNGVDHSLNDLKQLHFMFVNLKPLYRSKILHSDEFQSMMEQVFDIGASKFHRMTIEEKEKSLGFAVQMLSYCLKVIAVNMPKEFQTPLLHHLRPLNDLIEAIYLHIKKNNKTLPPFSKVALPIDEISY